MCFGGGSAGGADTSVLKTIPPMPTSGAVQAEPGGDKGAYGSASRQSSNVQDMRPDPKWASKSDDDLIADYNALGVKRSRGTDIEAEDANRGMQELLGEMYRRNMIDLTDRSFGARKGN